jgi:hypothetical protein
MLARTFSVSSGASVSRKVLSMLTAVTASAGMLSCRLVTQSRKNALMWHGCAGSHHVNRWSKKMLVNASRKATGHVGSLNIAS